MSKAVRTVLLGAMAFACVGCVHAPNPDSQRIDKLHIDGTRALSEAELKKKIVTTQTDFFWWVPLIGHIEWFDASTWQADLRRLVRYYEAHGFYQARVVDDQITETKPGHVELNVTVSEGAAAHIGALDFTGLEDVDPLTRKDLTTKLPLVKGAVFLEEDWQLAKAVLQSRLRESGYAEALVSGEAVVDADGANATLRLDVHPGQRFVFGDLLVPPEPNTQVPRSVIAQYVDLELKKGDLFSESALSRAQLRLMKMGVFSAVKVTAGASNADTSSVPVVIDRREAPFHSVRLGGGLGGDLIRQEVRLIGEYTNRNLGFSRLISKSAILDRLTLKAKVGWAFLPTVFDVARGLPNAQNGFVFRALAEYEVPRIFNFRTLSLQTSVDLSRTLEAAYDYLGAEGKLGVIWRPTNQFTLYPSLTFDLYSLNTDIPVFGNAPSAALGCRRAPATCLIGFLDVTAEWDRRDDRLEPKFGTYLSFSAQVGVSQTTTFTPYLRLVPEARAYWSFGHEDRFTIAGKLRVGTIISSTTDTPIVSRFFSGGSLMRGFYQRRLGPAQVYAPDKSTDDFLADSKAENPSLTGAQRDADVTDRAATCRAAKQNQVDLLSCRNFSNGTVVPTGGNGLIEASLELRWNLIGDLVLAAFSDAGLVTLEPLGPSTNFANSLYFAVGLGVRYKTPLGPIRLDLAYRLPIGGPQKLTPIDVAPVTVPYDNGCFLQNKVQAGNYAGSPENSCAFHLSIGEAF